MRLLRLRDVPLLSLEPRAVRAGMIVYPAVSA